MDLFDKHYQELINNLPMTDEAFLKELSKHGLLSKDENTKIGSLTESSERASYFLDNVIKPKLYNNNVLNLQKLLNIMKESKLEEVKKLTIIIKSELILCTYMFMYVSL